MSEHPLHDLAMEIRYALTEAQGKLTEMMRQIGELEVPAESKSFTNGPVLAVCCPSCGVGGDLHTEDCEFVASQCEGLEVLSDIQEHSAA